MTVVASSWQSDSEADRVKGAQLMGETDISFVFDRFCKL